MCLGTLKKLGGIHQRQTHFRAARSLLFEQPLSFAMVSSEQKFIWPERLDECFGNIQMLNSAFSMTTLFTFCSSKNVRNNVRNVLFGSSVEELLVGVFYCRRPTAKIQLLTGDLPWETNCFKLYNLSFYHSSLGLAGIFDAFWTSPRHVLGSLVDDGKV